jgi:hypothetical protein
MKNTMAYVVGQAKYLKELGKESASPRKLVADIPLTMGPLKMLLGKPLSWSRRL